MWQLGQLRNCTLLSMIRAAEDNRRTLTQQKSQHSKWWNGDPRDMRRLIGAFCLTRRGLHGLFRKTALAHWEKISQFRWVSFTTWGNSLGQQISDSLFSNTVRMGNSREPFRMITEQPQSGHPTVLHCQSPHSKDLDYGSLFIVSWLTAE